MSNDESAIDRDATLPPAGEYPTLPPAAAPSTPDRPLVHGYEIIKELGRGGMGVVYQARQRGLNRIVALKMILSGGHASPTDLARFKSEAEAVAKLQHPNIVQIHEVGDAGGLPYFSLEYCGGGSLDQKLAGTPQSPRDAAALIETLTRAIHAAHLAGIVHRDLKPANVLLSADGTPKITDFGLAKQLDSGSGRTASGAILGTPSYMAPEQANGSKDIGPAADTYALGAILYELLTGRPPFRAATSLDTILQVVSEEPVPPTRLNPQVPRDLETIALKCLAKEPAKRYASAEALSEDLRRFQVGEPITARPVGQIEKAAKWAKRRPAVAALSVAIVLVVAAAFIAVLHQLQVANNARERAETQEGLANQRADDLAKEQLRVRRELHQSDLLRADVLLQNQDFPEGEQLLWRAHLTRPDDDDHRASWRLWNLYRDRPRRFGRLIENPGTRSLSADGRRLAIYQGSQVKVFDSITGASLGGFQSKEPILFRIVFSADNCRIGVISSEGVVEIWDLNPQPRLRASLRPTVQPPPDLMMALGGVLMNMPKEQLRQGQKAIFYMQTQLCFLEGDRALVTYPTEATLWNLDSSEVLTRIALEPPMVSLDSYSPMTWQVPLPSALVGDLIPILRAGAVELWQLPRSAGEPIERTRLDFTDGTAFHRMPVGNKADKKTERRKPITAVSLSSDGKYLLTESDNRLRTWDVATGERRGETATTETGMSALTQDGEHVRRLDEKHIRLWRMPQLELDRTVSHLAKSGRVLPNAAPLADDQQTIAIEGDKLAVYDHRPPPFLRSLLPPDAQFIFRRNGADLASNGQAVVLASNQILLCKDGAAERIPLPRRGLLAMSESSIFLAPNGTTAISIREGPLAGKTATAYDLPSRRILGSFPLEDPDKKAANFPGRSLRVSPDGTLLAVHGGGAVLIADLKAQKVVRALSGVHASPWGEVMFTPKSRGLLGMKDTEMVIVNVADGLVIASTKVATTLERPIAFSPDGKLLATAIERQIILRDAATLEVLARLPTTTVNVGVGTFAPDGRMFATAGSDGKLRLWDMHRREELVAVDLGETTIQKLVFKPDGTKVWFVAQGQIGEVNLHAFDSYVAGNLTWSLLRLLRELDRPEAERVLERLRASHPDAYRAGVEALNSKATAPANPTPSPR